MTWPDLSEFKAISGRSATASDVSAGSAVFVLQDEGKPIGNPIKITLPQYARHIDGDSGEMKACIVIQAEEARGQRLIGAITLPDRQPLAGFFAEFQLLGVSPPQPHIK